MVATVKKRRVSKKSKNAWRKFCDTEDVDKFLDDKRLEERLGIPFSERKESDLYQVDTETTEKKTEVLTKRQKRQLPKSFRCFEMLKPHTAVPDPITKRNHVRTPEERKSCFVKKLEEQRRQQGIRKAKEIRAQRDRELTLARKEKNRPRRNEFCTDLWENENSVLPELEKAKDWLDSTTVSHTVKNIGVFKKNVPNTVLKKPSELPSVEAPHPGMSYNPSYEDHQSLLREVADTEMKVQKQERHLERVTTKMFSKVTAGKRDEAWLSEMSQGLDTPKDEEDTVEASEYKAVNPPAKNKKKSLQKRKKLKELKKLEEERKKTLTEKKKVSDVLRLKSLSNEIDNKEKKLAVLKEKREKVKAAKANDPKKLGKVKFQPLELEFTLGRELHGNLRNIKPEGNLLKSRFNSIQKRNIIEPTVRHMKKKGKVKKYEKKSYKMGWEPKGY